MTDFGDAAISWRKSSFSNSGDCVECLLVNTSILVRDSKDSQGTVLAFGRSEWSAFLAVVKVASSGNSELDPRSASLGGACEARVS
jgi:hypothetical protein